MSNLRIGYGEDIHRLVPGRKLLLAAVEIPFEKGLLGHSDADVVLHAVADSLLGALALGDIGEAFPDTDPANKDMDSKLIVNRAMRLVKEHHYHVNNVDICICCEKPKILPYRSEMRKNIAELLGISIADVSVKGKTNEGLDALGKGEAIKAVSVVLLQKDDE